MIRAGSPSVDLQIFDLGIPILGICYGLQLMIHSLGGVIVPGDQREFGKAILEVEQPKAVLRGLSDQFQVWMSHGDRVETLPEGFHVLARSRDIIAAAGNPERQLWGLQFHPEVSHTHNGPAILENFLKTICKCRQDWTISSFIAASELAIRQQVGDEEAICGLSGGVDSSVAALLVQRAIGDRLTCIFVDNGLLRKDEFEDVLQRYRETMHLKVIGRRAGDKFLTRLRGVEDPELKRKIIGEIFIRVFEEEAAKLPNAHFLVQGTLYPDVIESTSVRGPSVVIKSHHNVGGLPADIGFELVEPLRELFKDEVRRVALELEMDSHFVYRQPFPGPGLAVRILGSVTEERLEVLRNADAIVQQEISGNGLTRDLWQAFPVLLPVRSVGVMGDDRTYEHVCALRAVTSQDGMTADWARIPYEVLERISGRIVNEVKGINRVVYDITTKPPGTIEWE